MFRRIIGWLGYDQVIPERHTASTQETAARLPRIPGHNMDGLGLDFEDMTLDDLLLERRLLRNVLRRLHNRGKKTRGLGSTSTQEKCYDPDDPTLKFVDRDDDLDFLYEDFQSRRALMSCGHAVTPMSLTNWCRRLLEQGESRFVCGQSGCDVEWPYAEVCKMALLTPEEKEYFDKTMASNATRDSTKLCPVCKTSVVRQNQSVLNVHCTVCTANRGRIFEFCWQCLREWKGPAPRSDQCGNDGCTNESLKTLKTCPNIVFHTVQGPTLCPSIRACPTCGILLQHDNKSCEKVECLRCKVRFCFLCLKNKCLMCKSGVAPRQTSIPVWQKK
ncbi:hypothetical protein Q5P01_002578 [Channa striata]|uniref:RING-type domain-containing protein n=1 Tax=Channa striata TaxID=64152 RepID=A0AA88TE33_CHASR|nr:hypothetical protein Q5P01_002578 [Channa striata]